METNDQPKNTHPQMERDGDDEYEIWAILHVELYLLVFPYHQYSWYSTTKSLYSKSNWLQDRRKFKVEDSEGQLIVLEILIRLSNSGKLVLPSLCIYFC